MILGLALAVAAQIGSCQTVQSDRIYARDLAAAIPAFGALAPELSLSLSPIPGQRRVFHLNELKQIAHANGITDEMGNEVCFEWVRTLPRKEDLLAAMKTSLQGTTATAEIVELPANPIPAGVLDFPLSGVSGYSDGPVVWRGTITYAPHRSLPIWARVRVTAHERRLVAASAIAAGQSLEARDVKLEDYCGPLRHEKILGDPKQVIGLLARVNIASGSAVGEALLRQPVEVERGDTVQVVVEAGNTRIEAQGIAEEAGPHGAFVTIRNSKSGQKFRARVVDRDKVQVLPTSMAGLAIEGPKS